MMVVEVRSPRYEDALAFHNQHYLPSATHTGSVDELIVVIGGSDGG